MKPAGDTQASPAQTDDAPTVSLLAATTQENLAIEDSEKTPVDNALPFNQTNVLLNLDWSKIESFERAADNGNDVDEYVKLADVWSQLAQYSDYAMTSYKSGHASFYVSDGANYLQFQMDSRTGDATVTTNKNGKIATYTISRNLINDANYMNKTELIAYFQKVWQEEYYLEDMTLSDQRSLMSAITADLLITSRESDKNTLTALRNYMLTGKWKQTAKPYSFFSAEIKPLTTQLDSIKGLQMVLDVGGLASPIFSLMSIGLDIETAQLLENDVNNLSVVWGSTKTVGLYGLQELYPKAGKYVLAKEIYDLIAKYGNQENLINQQLDEAERYENDTFIHSVIIAGVDAIIVDRVVHEQKSVRYASIREQNVGGARPAPSYDNVASDDIMIAFIAEDGTSKRFTHRFK
jgi:hypothetical protein